MKQELIEIQRWLLEEQNADPNWPEMRKLSRVIETPDVDTGLDIVLTVKITAGVYEVTDQHGRQLKVRAVQAQPDDKGRPVITLVL